MAVRRASISQDPFRDPLLNSTRPHFVTVPAFQKVPLVGYPRASRVTSRLVGSGGDGLVSISISVSVKESGLSYVTSAVTPGMEVVHANEPWQGGWRG